MEKFPWHQKFMTTIDVYYRVLKRISTIVGSRKISDKSKIAELRMFLIKIEDDLLTCERDILEQQFTFLDEELHESQEKYQAGPIKCVLFLN
jgi:hypothetical protein